MQRVDHFSLALLFLGSFILRCATPSTCPEQLLGLSECCRDFPIDSSSTVKVLSCSPNNITLQINIYPPLKNPVFMVAELEYINNTITKKITLLGGQYFNGNGIKTFQPLTNLVSQSTQQWTILACYEDHYGKRYILEPLPCNSETGDQEPTYTNVVTSTISPAVLMSYKYSSYTIISSVPTSLTNILSSMSPKFSARSVMLLSSPAYKISTIETTSVLSATRKLGDLSSLTVVGVNSTLTRMHTMTATQNTVENSRGADDFDIKNILIGTACMFGFSVLFLTSIVVAYTIKLYKRIREASLHKEITKVISDYQEAKDYNSAFRSLSLSPSLVTIVSPLACDGKNSTENIYPDHDSEVKVILESIERDSDISSSSDLSGVHGDLDGSGASSCSRNNTATGGDGTVIVHIRESDLSDAEFSGESDTSNNTVSMEIQSTEWPHHFTDSSDIIVNRVSTEERNFDRFTYIYPQENLDYSN